MGEALILKRTLAGLLLAIVLLLYFGIFYYYYPDRLSPVWYDLLLHFLGGVWLTAFALYFLEKKLPAWLSGGFWPLLIAVSGFVMLIGVLWEFYEFVVNVYFAQPMDPLDDVLSDILMELIAAAGFFKLYWFKIRNKTNLPS